MDDDEGILQPNHEDLYRRILGLLTCFRGLLRAVGICDERALFMERDWGYSIARPDASIS